MKQCPYCKVPLDDNATICPNCGEAQPGTATIKPGVVPQPPLEPPPDTAPLPAPGQR
jgi:uncharacterized Zn finger protein (UPF0148 family)